MTDAQKMLFDFCRQQGHLQTEIYGPCEVKTVDANRQMRNYILTIYGDIYDMDAYRIIAKSTGSHDRIHDSDKVHEWYLVDHERISIRERLEQTKRLMDAQRR